MTVKNQGELLQFLSAGDANISSCKVYFSPKQSGEGTPSPENVRPIEGWSGVEVTHCGKNLFNGNVYPKRWNNDNWENTNTWRTTDFILVKPNTQYSIFYNTPPENLVLYTNTFDANMNCIAYTTIQSTITTGANAKYITLCNTANSLLPKIDTLMFIEGTQKPNSYIPYQSHAEKELPSEYQRVEYLESTGTQWIELPFGFLDTDEVEIKGAELTRGGDRYLVSPSVWNNHNNRFAMAGGLYKKFRAGFGNWSTVIKMSPDVDSDTLVHIWTYKNRKFSIDNGWSTLDVSNAAFSEESKNLKLFYGYLSPSVGQIYYYHHKKADDTEANLIPCLRRSDSKPGMYDTVSQTFYVNQGTGEFIAGPAVNRYEIDWSEDLGTIYGGYVDLVSGELVETWIKRDINNFSTIEAPNGTSAPPWNHRFNLRNWQTTTWDRESDGANGVIRVFSDCIQSGAGLGKTNYTADDTTGNWYVYDDTVSTVAEFKEKYSGHYAVYKLKPTFYTTHQLSPAILTTLTGSNTFWSNADYIEIEYDLIETQEIMDVRKRIIGSFPHLETAGGQFSTDMAAPLKSCRISFSPIQEGEGDPSPSNVRPISGWDGITVKRCGKNLYDPLGDDRQKIFIPKSTYVTAYGLGQIKYYREDGTLIDYWSFSGGKKIFKLIEDAYYFGITDGITSERMIGIGNNIPYEPYQGSTYTIPFPQTIYGGYVDLVKGEVVEEWVKVTLDGVTNNMKVNSDYSDNTYLITGVVYVKPPGKGDNYFVSNLYCDSMPLVADAVKGSNLPQDFPFIKTISNGELYLRIYHDYIANHPDLDTKQKRYDYANAYLMEHNVDVAYQLKTPIHHQIDSKTLTTLRGFNNVFSDANGSVELTYWTH